MFNWLSTRRTQSRNAHNLYGSIVAVTRMPALYDEMNVPDTLEMRFELLMLHMFVFLRWLNQAGEETGKLRQALVNRFFEDVETTSRQVGVGDLAVPKKMRQLATVYTERMEQYQTEMGNGPYTNLKGILEQTFYSGNPKPHQDARAFAMYLAQLGARLDKLAIESVIENPDWLTGVTGGAAR